MRELLRIGAACAVVFVLIGHAGAAPRPAVRGHATILPLSEGRNLPDKQMSGCWTPSSADLRNLEADLPKRLAPYCRQYLGITQRGRRLIYINGFSASIAADCIGRYDWHRHAVVVEDGGDGLFQATYDPMLRKLTSLSFNGPYPVPPKKQR